MDKWEKVRERMRIALKRIYDDFFDKEETKWVEEGIGFYQIILVSKHIKPTTFLEEVPADGPFMPYVECALYPSLEPEESWCDLSMTPPTSITTTKITQIPLNDDLDIELYTIFCKSKLFDKKETKNNA
jgi:hypothetical protein